MKQLFTAAAVLLLFTACKKENTGTTVTPAPVAGKKLTKRVSDYSNGTTEIYIYGYDNAGRLSSKTSDTYIETFDYVSSTKIMVTQKKKSTNELYQTKECTLDAQGRVTTIVYKSAAGAETYRYDYTYNAEGYLSKEKIATPANPNYLAYDYNYSNGNLTGASEYQNGVLKSTEEYIVDETKENKGPLYYKGAWASATLFGKQSKNLVKDIKIKSLAGAVTWHIQLTYELNSEKYPVKMVLFYPLLNFTENATLTFE